MQLIVKREDLWPEFANLDFTIIEYKHLKPYAQNAVKHCAVATFFESSHSQKKILSPDFQKAKQ